MLHATGNSPHVEAGVSGHLRLVPGVSRYLAETLEQAQRRVQQVVGQDSGAVHLEAVSTKTHALKEDGIRSDRGSGGGGSSTRSQIGIGSHAEMVVGMSYGKKERV